MKIIFFMLFFISLSSIQGSNQLLEAPVKLAQIYTTSPHLLIDFCKFNERALWKNFIKTAFEIDTIKEFYKENCQEDWHSTILSIARGVKTGVKSAHSQELFISEQTIAAILFFTKEININEKTIQLWWTDKYYLPSQKCWQAIKDHLFFARLIERGMISCKKTTGTFLYHPTSFSNDNSLPKCIKDLGRCYGPLFQEKTNFITGKTVVTANDCSLDQYANFAFYPYEQDNKNGKKGELEIITL